MAGKTRRWFGRALKALNFIGETDTTGLPAAKEALQQADKLVGDGTRASVIMAPLIWLAKKASTVPLDVMTDDRKVVNRPEMVDLIDQALLFETSIDVPLYGNAYVEIVRGGFGQPMRLRYLPVQWVEPKAAPDDPDVLGFVKVRRPGKAPRDLHVDDLIHVKMGIDPQSTLTGISPFLAMLQDAASDVQAALITATVLRNAALMGGILSPQLNSGQGPVGVLDAKQAEAWQAKLNENFSGAGRGKVLVTSLPVQLQELRADLEKMALQTIRGLSEERVAALIGVPAAVVGFGVGLRQTKVGATLRELRGIAWDDGVLPVLEMILDAMTAKLAPEFGDRLRFGYTLPPGHVSAVNAEVLATRSIGLYRAGIMDRAQAKEGVDLEVLPEDAGVYYDPPGADPTADSHRPGGEPAEDEAPPA